jgi:hypothetical protein
MIFTYSEAKTTVLYRLLIRQILVPAAQMQIKQQALTHREAT